MHPLLTRVVAATLLGAAVVGASPDLLAADPAPSTFRAELQAALRLRDDLAVQHDVTADVPREIAELREPSGH